MVTAKLHGMCLLLLLIGSKDAPIACVLLIFHNLVAFNGKDVYTNANWLPNHLLCVLKGMFLCHNRHTQWAGPLRGFRSEVCKKCLPHRRLLSVTTILL